MMVRVENQTIIGKKMNRGIYVITAIGESLSGEKNLVLILVDIDDGEKCYRRK